MGRRMKSTKSGKYINPTDQARKEARKRELKKNKKQRLIVRVAVLKGKDPYQIIADLERLDRMEYDFYNPPPLNEKVLKDKRRKLKETWDRICRLYSKEDKDKFLELKRLEGDYEVKRNELVKQFEAIKSAQQVNVEDIPLPSTIPLEPSSKGIVTSSILKNPKARIKQPPGCPPGLPPLLKEFICEDDDDDDSDDCEKQVESNKRIRFSDEVEERNTDGSNLQKFLQEIEQLSTDKIKNFENEKNKQSTNDETETMSTNQSQLPKPLNSVFFGSSVQPAPPIMVQPPRRPLIPPQMQISTPLIHSSAPVVRMPIVNSSNQIFGTNYSMNKKEKKQVTTIEARPQLRNLSADSTKFMPTALRVRRDEKQISRKPSTKHIGVLNMVHSYSNNSSMISGQPSSNKEKTNSKDDAYEQFMKEMNGLI